MESMSSSAVRETSPERRPQFWQVARRCCQIAGSIDVAFFFLFHLLGSPILAWVNVVSVAMYVAAYHALGRRRNRLAVGLIWTEVLVHAGLGTVLIGWESGFHYYLLMFIPALFVSASLRGAVIALLVLWGYYVGLDVLMWTIEPLQPVTPGALLAVHLFNLSVVFAMFSYLSFFYLSMVTSASRKLRQLATTDPLTGLLNRRHMTDLAEKELARFCRTGRPAGVILLDVDHFKSINDQFGHDVGDKVLLGITEVLLAQLRKQDQIARWGGEEYLALLPEADIGIARESAERIRAALRNYDWRKATGLDLTVTISAGVSEFGPGEDLRATITRADRALYRAKAEGRDRVAMGGVVPELAGSDS